MLCIQTGIKQSDRVIRKRLLIALSKYQLMLCFVFCVDLLLTNKV